MSEDPIKDGTNWYSYCAGNPVMFVDPLGLKSSTKASISSKKEILKQYNDGVIEETVNKLLKEQNCTNPDQDKIYSYINEIKLYMSYNQQIGKMEEDEIEGITYSVVLLDLRPISRNSCWIFSQMTRYAWLNNIDLSQEEAEKMALKIPANVRNRPSGIVYGSDISIFEPKQILNSLKKNGPIYAELNSRNGLHSVVISGMVRNLDGEMIISYSNMDGSQVITSYKKLSKKLVRCGCPSDRQWPWEVNY